MLFHQASLGEPEAKKPSELAFGNFGRRGRFTPADVTEDRNAGEGREH